MHAGLQLLGLDLETGAELRVVGFLDLGGAEALALERPAAGKTGTATIDAGDVSSSWFVGYTPQVSTAVKFSSSR